MPARVPCTHAELFADLDDHLESLPLPLASIQPLVFSLHNVDMDKDDSADPWHLVPPFDEDVINNEATAGREAEEGEEDEQPAPPPTPLQHSLPSQLLLDPSHMAAMHGSFFPASSAAASAQQPFGLAAAAAAATAARDLFHPPQLIGSGPSASAGAGQPPHPHPLRGPSAAHVWQRRAPGQGPLSSTPAGALELVRREPASAALSPLLASRAEGSRGVPLGGARELLQHPTVASSACYTDAGLWLGPSFRVGWGPGGILVYPGQWWGPGGILVYPGQWWQAIRKWQ
jgi:nuclear pore complex protein Nup98-Nup96